MVNTEEKYGLKLSHTIALFMIMVLNILWLICSIVLFSKDNAFCTITGIAVYLATAYYASFGYKKPHGNLLRYVILFHVLAEACLLVLNVHRYPTYMIVSYLAIIILTAYMAGRLNKYKQNLVISIIVLALRTVNVYFWIKSSFLFDTLSFITFFGYMGPITVWLGIVGAYITRYKLHKEAGFEDKK